MSSEFLLDYIPSFFTRHFQNENGDNLLLPLIDQYVNLYGDATYQAIQLRQMMSFEKCPFLIHETNITIDTRISNQYTDANGRIGYKINPEKPMRHRLERRRSVSDVLLALGIEVLKGEDV